MPSHCNSSKPCHFPTCTFNRAMTPFRRCPHPSHWCNCIWPFHFSNFTFTFNRADTMKPLRRCPYIVTASGLFTFQLSLSLSIELMLWYLIWDALTPVIEMHWCNCNWPFHFSTFTFNRAAAMIYFTADAMIPFRRCPHPGHWCNCIWPWLSSLQRPSIFHVGSKLDMDDIENYLSKHRCKI